MLAPRTTRRGPRVDVEDEEGLTHLERGFDMLTLIRSETLWRGSGSASGLANAGRHAGDIDADRERGRFPPDFFSTTPPCCTWRRWRKTDASPSSSRGADVTMRDVSGQTPLHMAMYNGSAAAALLS